MFQTACGPSSRTSRRPAHLPPLSRPRPLEVCPTASYHRPGLSEGSMPESDQTIAALREAVRLSPDNLPLRRHLAQSLLGIGRFDEAEKEYKSAIAQWPESADLKLGLAMAFYQQGKNSAALVIVEGTHQAILASGPSACAARAAIAAGGGCRAGGEAVQARSRGGSGGGGCGIGGATGRWGRRWGRRARRRCGRRQGPRGLGAGRWRCGGAPSSGRGSASRMSAAWMR